MTKEQLAMVVSIDGNWKDGKPVEKKENSTSYLPLEFQEQRHTLPQTEGYKEIHNEVS